MNEQRYEPKRGRDCSIYAVNDGTPVLINLWLSDRAARAIDRSDHRAWRLAIGYVEGVLDVVNNCSD